MIIWLALAIACAAAAKPVDGERRRTFTHAGTDRNAARDIHIARLGMDDIADNRMVDDIGGNTSLLDRSTGDMLASIGRCLSGFHQNCRSPNGCGNDKHILHGFLLNW